MDGIEIFEEEGPTFSTSEDFCDSVLSRYSSSAQEDHQHLCATIGTMSQEFKDHNIPSTPIAYFGAACSSIDRLSSSDTDPPSHVIDAFMAILSLVLPKVSVPALRKQREAVAEIVVRVLRLNSVSVGTVVSGLKCIAHLFVARDSANWTDVSRLHGVLVGFITDSRPKVRRQAHSCIRDVLQGFQGTSALAPASEEITKTFERFLLLAGGSNRNASEEARGGAQEVLFILDALKECLPLMSMKCRTTILKYYKTLLELHQQVVTRRVTDSLNAICLHPTLEVSAEPLLDLLCSLALYASTNETSADNMTFTARLLDSGMRKIYSINRQICVVKLPLIFSTLKG